MAQRTEKEETEFKAVPENITLCVKCSVAGNHASATNNLCQKCFNTASETSTSAVAASGGAKAAKSHALVKRSFRSGSSARYSAERSLDLLQERGVSTKLPADEAEEVVPAKREVNRCSGCRWKVGLTGFRCRCGELFCANHRYSDRHDCSYDYKSAGREAIARENPVVKAAKIVKI